MSWKNILYLTSLYLMAVCVLLFTVYFIVNTIVSNHSDIVDVVLVCAASVVLNAELLHFCINEYIRCQSEFKYNIATYLYIRKFGLAGII